MMAIDPATTTYEGGLMDGRRADKWWLYDRTIGSDDGDGSWQRPCRTQEQAHALMCRDVGGCIGPHASEIVVDERWDVAASALPPLRCGAPPSRPDDPNSEPPITWPLAMTKVGDSKVSTVYITDLGVYETMVFDPGAGEAEEATTIEEALGHHLRAVERVVKARGGPGPEAWPERRL